MKTRSGFTVGLLVAIAAALLTMLILTGICLSNSDIAWFRDVCAVAESVEGLQVLVGRRFYDVMNVKIISRESISRGGGFLEGGRYCCRLPRIRERVEFGIDASGRVTYVRKWREAGTMKALAAEGTLVQERIVVLHPTEGRITGRYDGKKWEFCQQPPLAPKKAEAPSGR